MAFSQRREKDVAHRADLSITGFRIKPGMTRMSL